MFASRLMGPDRLDVRDGRCACFFEGEGGAGAAVDSNDMVALGPTRTHAGTAKANNEPILTPQAKTEQEPGRQWQESLGGGVCVCVCV